MAVASQRLKRLERELGVRLLHRTTRQLHATPEGAVLAEQGRALVEDLEALTSGPAPGRHRGRRHLARHHVGLVRATVHLAAAAGIPGRGIRGSSSASISTTRCWTWSAPASTSPSASARSTIPPWSRASSRTTGACCAPRPSYLRRHGTPRTPEDLAAPRMPAAGRQPGAPGRVADERSRRPRDRRARAVAASKATTAKCCATRRLPGLASPCIRPGTSARTCAPAACRWCCRDYPIADHRHLRGDAATAIGAAAGACLRRFPRRAFRRKPAVGARSGKIAGLLRRMPGNP